MNPTTQKLQAQYTARFLVTTACVIAAATSAHLIWLGETRGHFLPAIGILIAASYAGWRGAVDLCRRRKQLRQFDVMHEHGPYDRREYVPAHEAAHQLGDNDGPNMWS
jgi:hypothetical protein